jgi:Ferric uptake regulator family
MTYTTKEAPSRRASDGDAEAYNRPDLNTGTSVAPRPTMRDRNRMVVEWADQFDKKYRNLCKTLGWRMDWDQGAVFATVQTIRKHHRKNFPDISRPTVYRRLGELEKAGVIKRVHQYRDDGSQRSSRYLINFSRVIQHGEGVYVGPPDEDEPASNEAAGSDEGQVSKPGMPLPASSEAAPLIGPEPLHCELHDWCRMPCPACAHLESIRNEPAAVTTAADVSEDNPEDSSEDEATSFEQ